MGDWIDRIAFSDGALAADLATRRERIKAKKATVHCLLLKHHEFSYESVCGIKKGNLNWSTLRSKVTCDNCLHILNNQEQETEMNRNDIERQMVALRRQLTRLEEQLEKQSEFEALYDVVDDGTVISFEYQFTDGGAIYSYAAIYTNGLWYTTGPRSPKGYTTNDLIRWLSEGNVTDLRKRSMGKKLL